MFDDKGQLIKSAAFPADAQAAPAALALVDDFVARLGFPPATHAKLAIVVEELVLNAIEHGCPGPGTEIGVALSAEPGGIGIAISDCGGHFDPREALPVETVPDRGGGAGLALVRAWAVIRDYARIDGVNRLDLLIPADV